MWQLQRIPKIHQDSISQQLRTGDLVFTVFFAADVLLRIVILKKKFFGLCVNYIDLAVACPELPEFKRWVELSDAAVISSCIMFRLNCPRFLHCSACFVASKQAVCLVSSGQCADIDGSVSLLYEPWPGLIEHPVLVVDSMVALCGRML